MVGPHRLGPVGPDGAYVQTLARVVRRSGLATVIAAAAGQNGRDDERSEPKFYVTTPIYYVNDVPHIGHAYTTVAGDVLTRWRRLFGDDVFYPDRHRRARPEGAAGRRGAWASRRSSSSTRPRERSATPGTSSTSPTTTSSAPPSPATTTRCRSSSKRVYDAGDIELGTYEGLYCVSCEAYYTEDELVDGNLCPIHVRPVEHVTEENYFFKLSRYEDKLLAYYAEHPEAVQPDYRLQRGARVHPAGTARLLDEPHVDHVGRPAAVGSEARHVRVVRRAVQLLHRGRLRRATRRASTTTGRSTTTWSARTSCASTPCTGPRC